MGYYTDISNSQYSAKNTALQNELNGVSKHSAWGVFLSQNAFPMALGLGNSIYNWTKSDNDATYGPAINDTEIVDTNKSIADISKFNAAMKAFGANPNKENAKALQDAYNANPENPTIARFYPNYKAKVEKLV